MEEDILERTTYKKELGGATIDGGMFNEKSTVEDRHAFLRKILSRSAPQMLCHQVCPISERPGWCLLRDYLALWY
jgi:hypothetical protein